MSRLIVIFVIFFVLSVTCTVAQDTIEDLMDRERMRTSNDRINQVLDLSDVYIQTDPAKASMLAEQALTLSKKMSIQEGEVGARANIGLSYYFKGDNQIAVDNILQALTIAKELKLYRQESLLMKYLSVIYEKMGEKDKALEMRIQSVAAEESAIKQEAMRKASKFDTVAIAKAIDDTLLSKVSQKKMDVLKDKYEYEIHKIETKTDLLEKQAEKKRREIDSIMVEKQEKENKINYLVQESQLKELELSRQRTMMFTFIVVIGLIMILFFVLLSLYRFKNRALRELKYANMEISLKNEELLKAYEKLEQLARTDPLTGLSNRRDMLEKIEYEKRRCDRSGNPFVLSIGDIDHFKTINDTYGHDAGDYVLTEISKLMTTMLRKQDIVGRWGGEEFLLFFPDTPLEGGHIVTEKVRGAINEHTFEFNGQIIQVSMTLGVCQYDKGMTIDGCLKKADQALYHGKEHGRNQVVLCAQETV